MKSPWIINVLSEMKQDKNLLLHLATLLNKINKTNPKVDGINVIKEKLESLDSFRIEQIKETPQIQALYVKDYLSYGLKSFGEKK